MAVYKDKNRGTWYASDESVIACTITKDSVEEEKEPMIEKNIA